VTVEIASLFHMPTLSLPVSYALLEFNRANIEEKKEKSKEEHK
jgi:hypothetical protein